MSSPVDRYRTRLDLLSAVILLGLVAPPLSLGFALAGWELALVFVTLTVLTAIVRTGGNPDLPGTFALRPSQAPGLFVMIESLARRAGLLRMPEVRILPGGQTNAAATLRGALPVLVVTEALLDHLDARKLGAVLAHETAHLAHRDLVLFRVAQTLRAATLVLAAMTGAVALVTASWDPVASLLWMLFSLASIPVSTALVASLSRTREFAADLGAARLTGDPGALADALETLEYRPRTWWDWWLGRRRPLPQDPAQAAFRTHPPTEERVRRLDWLARRAVG